MSGIEDLYDDLYPESDNESCPNKEIEHKKKLILPEATDAKLASGVLTSSRKVYDTNENKGDSEGIFEEISSDITQNNKIAKTQSETHLNNHLLKTYNGENSINFAANQTINENELNEILFTEQLNQYSNDENEFFHPSFQETELDEDKLNKLFEELFLSDEEEKLKYKRDEISVFDKAMQDFSEDKNANSEFYIKPVKTKKCAEDTNFSIKNEKLNQNKPPAEQYQDSILNCMKQEELRNEQMSKTNHIHVSEMITNFLENSYKSDKTMKHEKNPSDTGDMEIIEGMEEYRIKRGEGELEKICQTSVPYMKDKNPSTKINLEQAQALFEKLF